MTENELHKFLKEQDVVYKKAEDVLRDKGVDVISVDSIEQCGTSDVKVSFAFRWDKVAEHDCIVIPVSDFVEPKTRRSKMNSIQIPELYSEFRKSNVVKNFVHRCIEADINDRMTQDDVEELIQMKTCRMVLNHLLKAYCPDMNRSIVSVWVQDLNLHTVLDLEITWERFKEFYINDCTLSDVLYRIKSKYYTKQYPKTYSNRLRMTVRSEDPIDEHKLSEILIKACNDNGLWVEHIVCGLSKRIK